MLTYMDIVAAIRQLAAEMPDFIYTKPAWATNCSNLEGGCHKYPEHTGCIVGQAARRCGLMVPDEAEFASACTLLRSQIADADDRALTWISIVQGAQDNGDSWQEVIERADAVCPYILERQSLLATNESK